MNEHEDRNYFDPDHKFEVGERVIIFDTNARSGAISIGEVAHVGRKLLQVAPLYELGLGKPSAFRLDAEGVRPENDRYQHRWILTPEEDAYRTKRKAALEELKELGLVRSSSQWLSLEKLQALIAVLKEGEA